MELNYSGANDLEGKRAIHKAFWDEIRRQSTGEWMTREEFLRKSREIWEENKRRKDQQNDGDVDGKPVV